MMCVLPIHLVYDMVLSGMSINVSFLRVLRLLKLAKVIRVVRLMRFCRELRVMLVMVVGSLSTLFWALVMLSLIIYIFSIIIVQGVQAHIAEGSSDERDALLLEFWGSLGISMITLYQAITGGYDWDYVADPLLALGPHYYAVFCVYLGGLTLSVLNILIGMFCDKAMLVKNKDIDRVMLEAEKMRERQQARVLKLFHEDGAKGVSWNTFVKMMPAQPAISDFMRLCELELGDAESIFRAITCSRDEHVRGEDFIMACLKVSGDVKRRDVVTLVSNMKMYQTQMMCFETFFSETIDELCSQTSRSFDPRTPDLGVTHLDLNEVDVEVFEDVPLYAM